MAEQGNKEHKNNKEWVINQTELSGPSKKSGKNHKMLAAQPWSVHTVSKNKCNL